MKKVLLTVISLGIGFLGGIYALTKSTKTVIQDPEKYGKTVLFENDDIKVVPTSGKTGGWSTAGVIYKQ